MELLPETNLTASCLCSKATVTLHGPPRSSHYCHCSICQNVHSAPFALVAIYTPTNLTLPNQPQGMFEIFSPKDGLDIYRCRNCGVAVFSQVRNYKVWGVYMGANIAFNGARIRPSEVPAFEGAMHIFYAERQRDIK
jgi:hypothetical protein